MYPEITIGIIARNEEEFIGQTLESIMNQDFDQEKYEIIVVDGNSQDNTRMIAHNVLSDSGVSYQILNEKDFGFHGLCFARNLVIDHSSEQAEYIAYTDADCIVENDWLKTLYGTLKNTGERIAGAGGPRLIAPTPNKKELVINSLITSFLASFGNPAFTKRKIKFLKSIPNYNAIYKKKIIAQYRYDDSLIISDDNELNFRLRKAGYTFLYVPEARVYHRETDSVKRFSINMFHYGFNLTNTMRKHRIIFFKTLPPIFLIFYLISIFPMYVLIGLMVLLPLLVYVIYLFLVWIEVLFKSRTYMSLYVFLLLPLQHLSYGWGVLYNFISQKNL